MLKKIVVTILALSVLGAAVAAFVYQVYAQEPNKISSETQVLQPSQNNTGAQNTSNLAVEGAGGEPWQATGTIVGLDDNGMTLVIDGGDEVYVELGPSEYWQNQGVDLQEGQLVTVDGTIADDMIHASEVSLADDQVLTLRTDQGQPMWSGGVDNGQSQSRGQGNGDQVPEPQAQVDEWITINGTLMSFLGGNMTMSTANGELVAFQSGQPRFFASQGVTFSVGDEISVVGFYSGEQFTAGEIVQVSTGLRVMLRDPNGRPLWAGPGSGNGNSNGSGNGNGQGTRNNTSGSF